VPEKEAGLRQEARLKTSAKSAVVYSSRKA
jgi:hypothetical protein